jgi:hypothetical protein
MLKPKEYNNFNKLKQGTMINLILIASTLWLVSFKIYQASPDKLSQWRIITFNASMEFSKSILTLKNLLHILTEKLNGIKLLNIIILPLKSLWQSQKNHLHN